MKDNLSIVITIIVLVMLMVIFPLYNYFERQDDMSYNLVLKATTNFVDTVLNSGYIDQETYDKFINTIAATGNMYDVKLEAHRKFLIKNPDNTSANEYIESYEIDYNDDIFESLESNVAATTSLGKRTLKSGAYKFNEGDQFYIKLTNSNVTMAGAIFNAIVPTAKKNRISVNYGGIIKNNSWKEVDATYNGESQELGAPKINCTIQVELGFSTNQDLADKTIVLSTGSKGASNAPLEFFATGPVDSTQSWTTKLDSYVWTIDKSEQILPIGTNFKVTNLSEGMHVLTVKAFDRNTGFSGREAKLMIEVKKKVKRIIAGVGWNGGDIDLSFYFTKVGSTSTTRIDYANKIPRYGTITSDDRNGSTNVSSSFLSLCPSGCTIPYGKKINEYILLDSVNADNFENMKNDGIKRIDIFVNSFNHPTFQSYSNVYSDLLIIYEDNQYERVQVQSYGAFSSNKTVRMATLQTTNNGDWVLVSGEPVARNLGDNQN